MQIEITHMRRDKPFFDTIRWVVLGGIVGVILYFGHLYFLHPDQDEIDNHGTYSSEGGQL